MPHNYSARASLNLHALQPLLAYPTWITIQSSPLSATAGKPYLHVPATVHNITKRTCQNINSDLGRDNHSPLQRKKIPTGFFFHIISVILHFTLLHFQIKIQFMSQTSLLLDISGGLASQHNLQKCKIPLFTHYRSGSLSWTPGKRIGLHVRRTCNRHNVKLILLKS